MPTSEEIIQREKQFLLQTYNRYPLVIERGKGVFLFDLDGNKFLDFVAGLGVNALGHAHPRIVKVIREQGGPPFPFRTSITTNIRDSLPRNSATFPASTVPSFQTAAPKRLKALSSSRGLPDIAWEVRRKANLSRLRARTTDAASDLCR